MAGVGSPRMSISGSEFWLIVRWALLFALTTFLTSGYEVLKEHDLGWWKDALDVVIPPALMFLTKLVRDTRPTKRPGILGT